MGSKKAENQLARVVLHFLVSFHIKIAAICTLWKRAFVGETSAPFPAQTWAYRCYKLLYNGTMGEDPSRWDRTVYMGNLPDDIREQDIRYLLQDFGRIDDVDIKHAPHGVTYAFIEFRQARDASQAVHRRDGYDFEGEPLRVEIKDGFKGKGKGKKGKGYKSKNG